MKKTMHIHSGLSPLGVGGFSSAKRFNKHVPVRKVVPASDEVREQAKGVNPEFRVLVSVETDEPTEVGDRVLAREPLLGFVRRCVGAVIATAGRTATLALRADEEFSDEAEIVIETPLHVPHPEGGAARAKRNIFDFTTDEV
jgi:hypothetical protein